MVMSKHAKPRIFIGSSYESRAVMATVALMLKNYADVVTWTDERAFPPGQFILDSLMKNASEFDFAILVFGYDDHLRSRKDTFFAPRDNVIFELGLFMSQLTLQRTFVIAPRSGRKDRRIKILSDLAGLTLYEYEPPRDLVNLPAALEAVVAQISGRVDRLKSRPPLPIALTHGPMGAMQANNAIEQIILKAQGEKRTVTVRNIALTMEVQWHVLCHHMLEAQSIRNMSWKALMIDPDSALLHAMASPAFSPEWAARRAAEIASECARLEQSMRRRKIRFECRAYDALPLLHGFLINERTLLMSLSVVNGGKLIPAPAPYLQFERGAPGAEHYFDVFSGWFEFLWANSKRIWPR